MTDYFAKYVKETEAHQRTRAGLNVLLEAISNHPDFRNVKRLITQHISKDQFEEAGQIIKDATGALDETGSNDDTYFYFPESAESTTPNGKQDADTGDIDEYFYNPFN